jgi:hypothetical protein
MRAVDLVPKRRDRDRAADMVLYALRDVAATPKFYEAGRRAALLGA